MDNPVQKSLSGNVIGLLSAVKVFTRCKLVLKAYEKTTGVRKINGYTKRLMKQEESGETTEIKNGIKKVLTKNNADTKDAYYEGSDLVMDCNYTVQQGAMRKRTSFKCNFYTEYAKKHATYYFLAMSMSHDFVTDKTESFVNAIAPEEMKTLKPHTVNVQDRN